MEKPQQIIEIEKIIGKEIKLYDGVGAMYSISYIVDNENIVTGLNLYFCGLSNIEFLANLKCIKKLNLGSNKIHNLSPIRNLKNIEILDLSNNLIECIDDIYGLVNIKTLNLRGNHVCNIGALSGLDRVSTLYLQDNRIVDIEPLSSLHALTELHLQNNCIVNIHPLRHLERLTELFLQNNKISDISPLEKVVRHSNSKDEIKILDLSSNRINVIPYWLFCLDVDICFSHNHKRYYVRIGLNPIEVPPVEVISKGKSSALSFLRQAEREGVDNIYEAKLIIVGEERSGKTSLANKIIDPHYKLPSDKDSIPTKGIDIFNYSFPCQGFNYQEKDFKINIWDFAGEELRYRIHELFLTKNSLYFIVVDNRVQNPNFDYWLKLVELLGEDSPVIIVKNEKGDNQCPALVGREDDIRREFKNVKEILSVNLLNNRGLDKVVKKMKDHITDLPHIGVSLPKSWVRVKNEMKSDARNYINLETYFNICKDANFISKKNNEDYLTLSNYLHDIGACLHFQKNLLLKKKIILKSNWATGAIYNLFADDVIIKNKGIFNNNDIERVWGNDEYISMQGELLSLMKEFRLCYEVVDENGFYIAPQLLSEHALVYSFDYIGALVFYYEYSFMPKGIFWELVVRLHKYILSDKNTKKSYVWRGGALFNIEGAVAEVIEYSNFSKICIKISGANKGNLLNIICHEFDKIHKGYKRSKLSFVEFISCNCEKCRSSNSPHLFNYRDLNRRHDRGIYVVECAKSFLSVNSMQLIRGVNMEDVKKSSEKSISNISFDGVVNGNIFLGYDMNIKKSFNQQQTPTNSGNNETQQLLEALLKEIQALNGKIPDATIQVINEEAQKLIEETKREQPRKHWYQASLEGIMDAVKPIEFGAKVFEIAQKLQPLLTGV